MTNAEQAIAVVTWIESHGVSVSPDSRVGVMRSVLVLPNGSPAPIINPDHPNFEIAREALRDLQMLNFAREQLASVPVTSQFRQRLITVLRDTALPQEDVRNSPGRDVQCELYVAAVCMKAGMSPIFDEPDVRCSCDGNTYGIAVKRCKSYHKFERRIRGAVEQVQRAGLRGIVVSDVSVMLNSENQRIDKLVTDDQFRDVARFATHKFIGEHHDQLLEWFKGTEVRGFILIDHHVRRHPTDGWGLDTVTVGVDLAPNHPHDFTTFNAQYTKGLPMSPVS